MGAKREDSLCPLALLRWKGGSLGVQGPLQLPWKKRLSEEQKERHTWERTAEPDDIL